MGNRIAVAEKALGTCARASWRRTRALQVALGGKVIQAERWAGGQLGGSWAGLWQEAGPGLGGGRLRPLPPGPKRCPPLALQVAAAAACSPQDAVQVTLDTVSLHL